MVHQRNISGVIKTLAIIQQAADAGNAARETVAAAEEMLQAGRQNLDTQLEDAGGVLAQVKAQGKTIDEAVEQTLQQQQDAEKIAAAGSAD